MAQMLAGIPPGNTDTNLLNAASVKHDGTKGDKVTISDVLFVAQKLVGLRDSCFELDIS
jgi:hypothetical protein